jgi:SDR family mycofactocin-dependent oxidoreductase
MTGKLAGKVAFITGIAQGQGKAHALRLAADGADIIGVDSCEQFETVPYPLPSEEDLQRTVKEVQDLDRRIVAIKADVRDLDALQRAYDAGVAELGPVSIVVANAGIGPGGMTSPDQQWDDVLAINLKGVWNTLRVTFDRMIADGNGGSVILTSSTGGLIGNSVNWPGMIAYTAAKHGVIGLLHSYANIGAPHFIRVNSVAPTTVNTPMTTGLEDVVDSIPELKSALANAMPVFKVEPTDIANAVAWLASDDSRYVTGTVIPVDAGMLVKH